VTFICLLLIQAGLKKFKERSKFIYTSHICILFTMWNKVWEKTHICIMKLLYVKFYHWSIILKFGVKGINSGWLLLRKSNDQSWIQPFRMKGHILIEGTLQVEAQGHPSKLLRHIHEIAHIHHIECQLKGDVQSFLNQLTYQHPAVHPSIGNPLWLSCWWTTIELPRIHLGNLTCETSYFHFILPSTYLYKYIVGYYPEVSS